MARPTQSTRFGETAGGTPDAGLVEPPSGERDTGFQNGTASDATKLSWLLWAIYLWIKWLLADRDAQRTGMIALGNFARSSTANTSIDTRIVWTGGTADYVEAAVPVLVGDELDEVIYKYRRGTGITVVCQTYRINADHTTTVLETFTDNSSSTATWQSHSYVVNDTLAEGEYIGVRITAGTATLADGVVYKYTPGDRA
jgi:hypothetical protein